MEIDVWVMPKTKTVLVTDDPGVPLAACIIGDEPRENAGSVKRFRDVDEAMHYAKHERDKHKYALQESWRFAPWADPYYVGNDEAIEYDDE
jgi:hypothetical protein